MTDWITCGGYGVSVRTVYANRGKKSNGDIHTAAMRRRWRLDNIALGHRTGHVVGNAEHTRLLFYAVFKRLYSRLFPSSNLGEVLVPQPAADARSRTHFALQGGFESVLRIVSYRHEMFCNGMQTVQACYCGRRVHGRGRKLPREPPGRLSPVPKQPGCQTAHAMVSETCHINPPETFFRIRDTGFRWRYRGRNPHQLRPILAYSSWD